MNAKKIILIVVGVVVLLFVVQYMTSPGPEVPGEPQLPEIPRDRAEPVEEQDEPEKGVDPVESVEQASEGVAGEDDVVRPEMREEAVMLEADRRMVPAAATFQEWLSMGEPEGSKEREVWLAEGMALAQARQPQVREWIQEDPERAIEEALTPRAFAALPQEIQALVERPVAKEGFYGVLAVCSHGQGEEHVGSCEIRHEVVFGFGTMDAEFYKANIYGERQEKMTVEQDSIYGVILDDQIALHEHDLVIIDDGEGTPGGRYAVYYRGQVVYADTLEAAERFRAGRVTSDE